MTQAPTFKTGTINIGERQTARLKAESVIDCDPNKESIGEAITKLYSKDFRTILKTVKNPYGDGVATDRIIEVIRSQKLPNEIKKKFFDV